ncbi:DUF4214 domain-containing protein [Metarhizobium album]|nr:DUF4214 domain-containing protein [Rhizobium album]
MAITATYSTPASEWTRSLDYAFRQWSAKIPGNAQLDVAIAFDPSMHYLASCLMINNVNLGSLGGKKVLIPSAAAKLQDWTGTGRDFLITINPTYPWHFGPGNPPGAYCAESVMTHEIGHALFMAELRANADGSKATPYMLWRDAQPPAMFANDQHFAGGDSLMTVALNMGARNVITDTDMAAAKACGLPIPGASRIYLAPGGRVDVPGAIGVWLGSFSAYSCRTSGMSMVEMPGDNALTSVQEQLYRLYRATMGRCPDLAGYRFWLGQNMSLLAWTAAFMTTPEFLAKNPANPASDRPGFVRGLYRNILGRDPEPAGLQWWIDSDFDAVGLVANIALSGENAIGVPMFTM